MREDRNKQYKKNSRKNEGKVFEKVRYDRKVKHKKKMYEYGGGDNK